jgi:hypothetical protein
MKNSNTLDRMFCVEAAEEAVRKYGYPEIIHADRGETVFKQGLSESVQGW